MRRGLVLTILAVAALVGLPAGASAAEGDPIVYMGINDGWYYPQGADVSFGFLCVSPTSFIVSCEGSQPPGSKLDTFHAGPHMLSVTATDYEGRQTTATVTYTVIDTTKPHVIFRTPSQDATFDQGSLVTVDFSCEDDPGGLGILDDLCFGTLPVGAPLDTSHVGFFSFWVTTLDRGNNIAQEAVHYSVVDRTPPKITIETPAEGATYTLGQQVSTSFTCEDPGGSGVLCGDPSSGSLLDTSTIGTKTFTVTASDHARNVASLSHTYSVIYDFTGFASPAAPYPNASAMKAGEGIPLKFSLHGNQGPDIFAAGSPGWIPCAAFDGPSQAAGSLSYNASADRYTFLATTAKSWAGTCRDLVVILRDGTTHRARFSFTK